MTHIPQNPAFEKASGQVSNGFDHFNVKADAFDLHLIQQTLNDKVASQAHLTIGPTFTCSTRCPTIPCGPRF